MYIIVVTIVGITVHCHSIQVCCNTLSYIQLSVLAEDTIGSLRLIYQLVFFLLLLSGNVEINPGPKIDDQPNVPLLLELLKPLVDWKPFGRQLPGMTREIIETIEESENDINLQKERLLREWLTRNTNATWKDVILALKRRKEFKLVALIINQLESQECSGRTLLVRSTFNLVINWHLYFMCELHVTLYNYNLIMLSCLFFCFLIFVS